MKSWRERLTEREFILTAVASIAVATCMILGRVSVEHGVDLFVVIAGAFAVSRGLAKRKSG